MKASHLQAGELARALESLAERLRAQLAARDATEPLLIGVHTGGVWIAERLQAVLGVSGPLGKLDISFYRDDFTRIGMNPQVRPSQLPFDVEGRTLVLVDDVLHTGRTVRAALNEIFDYGRPAAVLLAVLVDRGGRELPIAPDAVGLELALAAHDNVKLTGPAPLELVIHKR